MVIELVNMVKERINARQKLCVASENKAGHIMTSGIPEEISTEDNAIYIESRNFIFHVTDKEEYIVLFDEEENTFVIKQGNMSYYLS